METQSVRHGTGFGIYLAFAILILVLSILSGFSIGLFILPIPLVMLVAIAWWGRPWIVAGLVAGVVAGSLAYLLTAPLISFERTSVGIGGADRSAGLSGCERSILSYVPSERCDEARVQALAIGGISALVVGLGTGLFVRTVGRTGRN
jgi:hypothetical protein